jgi:phosphoribosyl-dephospho-CoA transferase
MGTLHRHQLAYLAPAAWARIVDKQDDAATRACLKQWATSGLPVVVTRQPERGPNGGDDRIQVGLSAPAAWERRRLALHVARQEILRFDEFPRAERIVPVLTRPAREPWRRLCAALADCSVTAHVYGSHGWQCLSGFKHVHEGSDLDLWVAVETEAQADAVAAVLQQPSASLPRLDGELQFGDGSAVSWREWLGWRSGRTRALLVRTLDRSFLRWSPAPATWSGTA